MESRDFFFWTIQSSMWIRCSQIVPLDKMEFLIWTTFYGAPRCPNCVRFFHKSSGSLEVARLLFWPKQVVWISIVIETSQATISKFRTQLALRRYFKYNFNTYKEQFPDHVAKTGIAPSPNAICFLSTDGNVFILYNWVKQLRHHHLYHI